MNITKTGQKEISSTLSKIGFDILENIICKHCDIEKRSVLADLYLAGIDVYTLGCENEKDVTNKIISDIKQRYGVAPGAGSYINGIMPIMFIATIVLLYGDPEVIKDVVV